MPEEADGLSLVVTTLETAEQARTLARQLVEERLIACGNVLPGVSSIYRWEGRIEQAGEVLLLMKTRTSLVPGLFARIAEIHPYEVPELVSLRADEVSEAYARWMLHETTEVTG